MKVINRFLSILLILSVLVSQVTVFAASISYDAGYDAGMTMLTFTTAACHPADRSTPALIKTLGHIATS